VDACVYFWQPRLWGRSSADAGGLLGVLQLRSGAVPAEAAVRRMLDGTYRLEHIRHVRRARGIPIDNVRKVRCRQSVPNREREDVDDFFRVRTEQMGARNDSPPCRSLAATLRSSLPPTPQELLVPPCGRAMSLQTLASQLEAGPQQITQIIL
jgi:hypothetical protein